MCIRDRIDGMLKLFLNFLLFAFLFPAFLSFNFGFNSLTENLLMIKNHISNDFSWWNGIVTKPNRFDLDSSYLFIIGSLILFIAIHHFFKCGFDDAEQVFDFLGFHDWDHKLESGIGIDFDPDFKFLSVLLVGSLHFISKYWSDYIETFNHSIN